MKNLITSLLPYIALFAMFFTAQACAQKQVQQPKGAVAIFSDGCFWCTEYAFEQIQGVYKAVSGFAGGTTKNPTYSSHGDHAEAVRVYYDSSVVSYEELVNAYFDMHTRGNGPDQGSSYRAIIYPGPSKMLYVGNRLAEEQMKGNWFEVEIIEFSKSNFHPVSDYHQNYVQRYLDGEKGLHVSYLEGESLPRFERFKKKTKVRLKRKLMSNKDWKKKLDNEEYYVMVKKGTERPFSSPLYSEDRVGVYTSAATGDVLFRSSDKFNSGTGWPSFSDATDKVDTRLETDGSGRIEVIEKSTGLHLGHLFHGEGFTPENKRFCINGDALEFKEKK